MKTARHSALFLAIILTLQLGYGHAAQPDAGGNAPVDGKEAISLAACQAGAFDYTSRFPPERDQGAQGQCFAFAAAGLLDEHACALGTKEGCTGEACKCGVTHFSEIDLARDYPDRRKSSSFHPTDPNDPTGKRDFFNLSSANQGGFEDELLEAGLEFGVCEERFAPWFPELNQACREVRKDRSSCVLSGLKEQWQRYHRAGRGAEYNYADRCYLNEDSGAPLSPFKQRELERILAQTGVYLEPQIALGLDLRDALENSESEFDFIEYVLTPPACEKNRTRLSGEMWSERWTVTYAPYEKKTDQEGWTRTTTRPQAARSVSMYTNAERFDRLVSRISRNGRSVALGICSKFAMRPSKRRADDSTQDEQCGNHALIANGIRWNSGTGRCEIHIRNSWGEKSQLRGWLPIEPILNSTYRFSGITPGRSP